MKCLKCISNIFLRSSLNWKPLKYLFWDIKPMKTGMLLFDLVDIEITQTQFIEVRKET